ncbi:MAG: PH domain-containing protein [Aeromicrobium erythreum]
MGCSRCSGPIQLGWFFLVAGLVLGGHAVYVVARESRDVFVITDMRVFRASGVFSVRIATMPITRILDITVEKPLLGRLLGYGHFVFESAAQAQGLRDIRSSATRTGGT